MMNPINRQIPSTDVWIVEDDAEYRRTLGFLISHSSDLDCSETFESFEDLERHIEGVTDPALPDVILMDIGLPGTDGIEATGILKRRFPDLTVVMLTVSDVADSIFRSLRAGASGYLLKDTPVEETLSGIKAARAGGMLMPPSVARKVLDYFNRPPSSTTYGLSSREKEVLDLLGEGLTQREIADRLFLSPHTVDNHLRSIYRKLHVRSATAAVAKAYRERVID